MRDQFRRGSGNALHDRRRHLGQQFDGGNLHRSPAIDQRRHASRTSTGKMETRVSGACSSSATRGAETSPAVAAAISGSRDSTAAASAGASASGNRNPLAGGRSIGHSEEHRGGGEAGGGVGQRGAQFVGIAGDAQAADGLVELLGLLGPGKVARILEKGFELGGDLGDVLFQQLAGAGRHSCL